MARVASCRRRSRATQVSARRVRERHPFEPSGGRPRHEDPNHIEPGSGAGVPAPMKRRLQRRVEAELARAHLLPPSEILPSDIVVVAHPGSGEDRMVRLLAELIFGIDLDYAPPGVLEYLFPELERIVLYQRYGETAYFISHALPRPEYRRVLYVLRDGRDVMASLFNDGRTPSPSSWREHVEAWTSNPFGADMITIRYEDLLSDGASELGR